MDTPESGVPVNVDTEDAGALGVFVAVMQGIKSWLPEGWNRFLPVVALIVALAFGFLMLGKGDWKTGLIKGFLLWTSGTGLYRMSKVTFGFEHKKSA